MDANATRCGNSLPLALGHGVRLAVLTLLAFAWLGSVRAVRAEDGGLSLAGGARAPAARDGGIGIQPLIKSDGTWVAQGPAPIQDGGVAGIVNGAVSGAVHAVAAHPTNADILYAGAVNGGVWRTDNANAPSPTWRPLTDGLPSLSIGALEFDPTDGTGNTLLAGVGRFSSYAGLGGPTGYLYRTTDGGTTWTVLEDPLLAPANVSGVAARGPVLLAASNQGVGGILRSADTGATWAQVGGAAGSGLPLGIVGDMVGDPTRPTWIYAAVLQQGIYLSMDTGVTWIDLSAGNATLNAAITSARADNAELAVAGNGRVYAAVLLNGRPQWIGYSNGDATWTRMDVPRTPESPVHAITAATNATPIVITSAGHLLDPAFKSEVEITGVGGNVAANGVFTITVIDDDSFSLDGSAGNGAYTGGGTFRLVVGTSPRFRPGGQGQIHFSIAANGRSANDANFVYVGGDSQSGGENGFPNFIGAGGFHGRLFRGDAGIAPMPGAVPSPQWFHLTHAMDQGILGGGTGNGSAPHADSREMVFDLNGSIIESDDGGVFRRTTPKTNAGDWFSVNGDLQVTEIHDIAYDSFVNVLMSGNQDNGTTHQTATGSRVWREAFGGDGGDVKVDDTGVAGMSLRYFSFQNLGAFRRRAYDATNTAQMDQDIMLTPLMGSPAPTPRFRTPIELNTIDPSRLVIAAANGVYESMDRGDTIALVAPNLVAASGEGDAIAYGGRSGGVDNPDVLYVGSTLEVHVRTAAGAPLVVSAAYPGQGIVEGVVLDPDDWRIAYVCDAAAVYRTADVGATWQPVTGNLPALGALGLRALEYVPAADGVDGVVVAGDSGVYVMRTSAPGTWERLGQGLPNAPVWDLDYDRADDVLVVGTLGRGAWSLTPLAGPAGGTLTVTCPTGVLVKECNVPGTPTGSWAGTLAGLNVTGPANAFPLALKIGGLPNVAEVTVPDYVLAAGAVQIPMGVAPLPGVPVGMQTVRVTFTGQGGETGACDLRLDVVDTTAPMLMCPMDVTVPATGPTGATVIFAAPLVLDNCDMTVPVVCNPASGTLFPVGPTMVTCTATDQAGNTAMCSFVVTVGTTPVNDPPVVTCQSVMPVEATGPTGAVVTWPAPTVTDDMDAGLVATCVPASGSLFALGTTTVTCTATDSGGLTGTCTFEVTVRDTTAPVVTCPTVQPVVAPDLTGAVVSYPAPTVTDVVSPGLVAVCNPPSGALFPIGTTTVTCTATDAAGNTGTCTFPVVVEPPGTPLTITCPPAPTVPATSAAGAVVTWPSPTTTGGVAPVAVACVPPSGTFLPVGTTTVTCTATDAAGQTRTCSFVATVTPPPACSGPLRRATVETEVFVGDTPALALSARFLGGFASNAPVIDMVAIDWTGAFPGPQTGLQDVLRVASVVVTNGTARIVLEVTADPTVFAGGVFGDGFKRLDVIVNGRRNVGIARFNGDEIRPQAWFSWNPRCGDRPACVDPQPVDVVAACPERFRPRYRVTAVTRAP